MKYSLIVLAFLLDIQLFAQMRFDYPITEFEPVKFIVTYSMEYQEDSLDSNFIKKEDMLLLLGQNTSKFLSENLFFFDSIMRQISNINQFQAFTLNPQIQFPAFAFQIYKNVPVGKITVTDHVIPDSYLYEEPLDLFKWQLSTDTATINGYQAKKATCDFGGRSWVAWFSTKIPYSDGPYKFNGLPGLILDIHDTRNQYVFEMLSIKRPGFSIKIDRREKDFIETTKQDFFKVEDAFREDIINRAKEAGLSNEVQQSVARKMEERNNPIELIRK